MTIVTLGMTVATGDKVNVNEVKDVLLNAPAGALPYTLHLGHVTQAAKQEVRAVLILSIPDSRVSN